MVKSFYGDRISEILKIAAPCIMEQLLNVFVGMVSIAIIGRLGSNEFVSVSMTNQLIMWLQFIFIGLSTGATVIIARMYGEGDIDGLKNSFRQNLLMSAFISLIILFFSLVFKSQIILTFFGEATDDVISMSMHFFSYAILTTPAIAITSVLTASSRGIGDNKTPFYSALFVNATNILLSLILVNGVPSLSIPQLGIAGAGIAIIAARYICLLFTTLYIIRIKSLIIPNKLSFSFEKASVLRLLKVGMPSALEQFIFQGGFVVQQTVLIGLGTAFQGGFQIGANINGLLFAPAMGLGVAMTVMVSQMLGRKDIEGAEDIVGVSTKIVNTAFVFLGIAVFAFSPLIASIYTSDLEIIASGTVFARMFGLLVIPLAYFQTLAGVLRGGGDVKYIATISIVGLWVMRIFMVIIISRLTGNGYIAVITGVSGDFLFRAVMFYYRVAKGEWKYIRI